jgi:hypothetical protein
MKKYDYYTCTCEPEQLDDVLQKAGEHGWLYLSLVVMQSMVQQRVQLGQPAPQMKTEFKLIFYKEKLQN